MNGCVRREYIQNNMVRRLVILAQSNYVTRDLGIVEGNDWQKNEMQFQSIRIISLLIKFDDQWLTTQPDLVEVLKQIWCDNGYLVSILNVHLNHKLQVSGLVAVT